MAFVIEAPKGSTCAIYKQADGIRADILFELDGCWSLPTIVFIPGTNWSAAGESDLIILD
jgi:hypothetical protein